MSSQKLANSLELFKPYPSQVSSVMTLNCYVQLRKALSLDKNRNLKREHTYLLGPTYWKFCLLEKKHVNSPYYEDLMPSAV